MRLQNLSVLDFAQIEWANYDVLLFACGFESRSVHIFGHIPDECVDRCVCLGFPSDRDKLSRIDNDETFQSRGLAPFVDFQSPGYEAKISEALLVASARSAGRRLRVFVDYSVMTRAWYAYVLTWFQYSDDAVAADIDFAYSHGIYDGNFDHLQIEVIEAIQGFEGSCAGSRRTVAFYGLGYDKDATLAVHDQIEPDSYSCYVAREQSNDPNSLYVQRQNSQIINSASSAALFLPLSNVGDAFRILEAEFEGVPIDDEIIAVPMGPKPHILATLLVAQRLPRVTCLHAKGRRETPVQVSANGQVSFWRVIYS